MYNFWICSTLHTDLLKFSFSIKLMFQSNLLEEALELHIDEYSVHIKCIVHQILNQSAFRKL